ncbi:MAG: hypothetical protein ACC645_00220, partial [Pirellulales bacterium]
MVLLVVLVVVTMLSLAGFSFAEWMFVEHQSTRLFGEALQIEYVMQSGEEFAKWFAEQPWQDQQQAGGTSDNPDLLRGVAVLEDRRSGRRGRFSLVAQRVEDGQVTGVRFGLENESARLNLAVLIEWDRVKPGSGRQALLRLPGMTVETADALLDWIDSDSQPREYGAEDDYYTGLDPPYAARNGIPVTLEELLLIKEMPGDRLFGPDPWSQANEDPTSTGQGQATERPSVATDGPLEGELPWASLLTLYSAERNATSDGQPRIGLNGGDLAALHRRLTEKLGREWADLIVAYRQYGPYTGPEAPSRQSPPTIDVTLPARFALTTILDLVGARVMVPSTKDDSFTLLDSPLTREQVATSDALARLLELTTIDVSPVIIGRIDLNTASSTVLRAIPGMDDATAERILAARSALSDGNLPPKRRSPAWPLTEGLIDLKTMKRLLPYVTTHGDVYRTQVVGFFDTRGPSSRVEIVIDAAHRPAREVYR